MVTYCIIFQPQLQFQDTCTTFKMMNTLSEKNWTMNHSFIYKLNSKFILIILYFDVTLKVKVAITEYQWSDSYFKFFLFILFKSEMIYLELYSKNNYHKLRSLLFFFSLRAFKILIRKIKIQYGKFCCLGSVVQNLH